MKDALIQEIPRIVRALCQELGTETKYIFELYYIYLK